MAAPFTAGSSALNCHLLVLMLALVRLLLRPRPRPPTAPLRRLQRRPMQWRSTAGGAADNGRVVSLQIEYVITEPRGSKTARRAAADGGGVAYAHTIGEAGSARRWMPCIDCPQVRCPMRLYVTADASLQVHATGTPLPEAAAQVAAAAAAAASSSSASASQGGAETALVTRGFALDHPVTASQLGFVVGHLSSVPHPILPDVTLAIGRLSAPADAEDEERRWAQMLYLARHLPSLFACLREHLLGPSLAAAEAAEGARPSGDEAGA